MREVSARAVREVYGHRARMIRGMNDPYARFRPADLPPLFGRDTPPVWRWYVAYVVLMALVYVGCVVTGLVLVFSAEGDGNGTAGVLLTFLGVVLAGAFIAAPLLPRKPWAWTYHLVLICFSLSSACCMPVCVPLLIHWLKPRTKAFFGRI